MKKITAPASTNKPKATTQKPALQKQILSANLAHEIADLYNIDNIGVNPPTQG
jgi:hypothetical protein